MKLTKLILIVTFCLGVVSGQSQEHLQFKNRPIDGKVTAFAQALQQQGFIIVKEKEKKNLFVLKGLFINRLCEVRLVATKRTALIWKVSVFLPQEDDWYALKNDYLNLQKQFIVKYGEGKSYEFFSEPYFEGDGREIKALKNERCHYITYWEKPEGIVALQISRDGQIVIIYEDAINAALDTKETTHIISNDI